MKNLRFNGLATLAVCLVFALGASVSAQRDHGNHGSWGGSRSGGDRGSYGSSRGDVQRSTSNNRGTVHYGTNNNVSRDLRTGRVSVDRMPPLRRYEPHDWAWNHHDLFHDGYRWGYYHYDRWWRDDSFLFGFYLFSPVGPWVYSPWYYYPSLPPYISQDRVIIVNSEPSDWGSINDGWREYRWTPPSGGRGDYTDLDYALQDLTIVFDDRNPEAISRLCPSSGRVAIYSDGRYGYSLNSGDFYDTFKDGATGPRTTNYRILQVKTNGHDVANVLAQQDYTDPWGKAVSVFHTYRLVQEGPNVVIRSFGTYQTRPW